MLAKPRAERLATADTAESAEGFKMMRKFSRFGGLRMLRIPAGDTPASAATRLLATGRYEFVEPDYTRHATGTLTPNDPDFSEQWGLNNTGTNGPGEGIPGADIHAETAWSTVNPASGLSVAIASGVIVAVLDTGVDTSHVDLTANLWHNPQEDAAYPGDLYGINLSGNANTTGNPTDDNGHGTHVAGILGAVGNNGLDTSGVAWTTQIMALKFLNAQGTSGSVSDEDACIQFAIEKGASVINASFGSSTYSSAEYTAIQSAGAAGIIFVAAAGNDFEDTDLSPFYPAAYVLDNIVGVAASDNRDDAASFTNYGSGLADLAAPGDSILSTYWTAGSPTNATAILSGTSMATPFVTGSLALLKAEFPSDTYRQLINRLLNSVDQNANWTGKTQTGGRLNLANAVTATNNTPFNDNFSRRPHLSGTALTVRSSNVGATRESGSGEPLIAGNPGGASLWWDWTAPATGTVTITTTGSAYSALLAVYTGTSLGSLTAVASDATPGTGLANVSFVAQAGVTYEITVDGQGGATGLTSFNLSYSFDTFSTPLTLSGASISITGTNLNATRQHGEPRIAGYSGGHSVWFAWTAPKTAQFQVSAFSLDFDPLLNVYTGSSVSALTSVALAPSGAVGGVINTDAAVPASTCACAFNATAGTTYAITVDGSPDPNGTEPGTGQFTLSIADSAWSVSTKDAVTCSPTVGADGTIYVGGDDGYFYATNSDGSAKWKVNLGTGMDTSAASLSSDGSTIYVTSGASIYALPTASGSPTIWQYSLTAATPPTLGSDGTIYVKDEANNLYALNPAVNGSRLKWSVAVPGSVSSPLIGASYAAPVVGVVGGNDRIYLGSDNSLLYAIDAATGGTIWTFPADGAIYTAPAIDSSGNIYFGSINGTLYAISPAGSQIWSYKAGNSITSSPAIGSNGVVYFGCYDHNLYALNASNGSLAWTYALGNEVRASSPAIDGNGVIYVGCYDNNVYAINPNGSLNRIFATGYIVRSSPVIFDDALYFGSEDHKIYAFNIGAGAGVAPWPMYLFNSSRIGRTPAMVTAQPQGQTVAPGQLFSLSVAATGSGALTYQWELDGAPIAGAMGPTYAVSSFSSANAGAYTVVISGSSGSITSNVANVVSSVQAPAFTEQPVSVTVASGHSAVFNVAASGSPAPTYQWSLNGAPLAGATDPILDVPGATSANAGTYTCMATNSVNAVTSSSATLTVATTSNPGHLINLSTRANVGTGNNILIGGFAIGGSGMKPLLVRGVGPALTVPLGGSGELAAPELTLLDAGAVIASDIGWGNALILGPAAGSDSPQPASGALMDSLGAATYAAGSADTAMVLTAPVGNGTAEVSGVGGTSGIALVEFYDADTAPTPTAHLINISARADVGTGNNILIGGFAVSGATSETVLIRAVGPGLVDSDPVDFSLATVLNQPVLTLLNSSGVAIYSNTVWGGDATLAGIFPIVGAFGLNPAHADSVLLVTLPPGTYTAEVSGLNGGSGIALCEIYEVR